MPTGPKGERRPADVNARAVIIGKIATGEIEDVTTDDGKNAAARRRARPYGWEGKSEGAVGKKTQRNCAEGCEEPVIGLRISLTSFFRSIY